MVTEEKVVELDGPEDGVVELLTNAMKNKRKPKRVTIGRHLDPSILIPPEPFSPKDAMKILQDWQADEERRVTVQTTIACYPVDGAIALAEGIREVAGYAASRAVETFFGDINPLHYTVDIGFDENGKMQQGTIIWGEISLPQMGDTVFRIGYTLNNDKFPIFSFTADTRKKYQPLIDEIAAATKRYVVEHSIYRGQAIAVDFRWMADQRDYNPNQNNPEFLWMGHFDPSKLILNRDVRQALVETIFARIKYPDQILKMGESLKQGILLAGAFGTGKTMTANLIAYEATKAGWTFIYVKRADQITQAIKLGQMYEPSIVFCEDIDRATSAEERNAEIDAITNALDGVDNKDAQVMVVFTTNSHRKIHQAVRRAGRIDRTIIIGYPNAESTKEFVEAAGIKLVNGADYSLAFEALANMPPANVVTALGNAKTAAMYAAGGKITNDPIPVEILVSAANTMKAQFLESMATDDNGPDLMQTFLQMVAESTSAQVKGDVMNDEFVQTLANKVAKSL